MKINLNGDSKDLPESVRNLGELASHTRLKPDHIIIEQNLRIVPRDLWPQTNIEENDVIEIISFVGGG